MWLAVVVCLAMVLIPATSVSAQGVVVSVSVNGANTANVPLGGEFIANINVSQVTDLVGYDLFMSFDPDVVQVVTPHPDGADSSLYVDPGLINGVVMPLDMSGYNPTTGNARIAVFGHFPQSGVQVKVSGSGYLAQVHFRVVGALNSNCVISLSSVSLYTLTNGLPVEIPQGTPVSASVTVAPAVPVIGSVTPNTGNQGASNLAVTLTGSSFTDTTAVSFGDGITQSFVVNSSTQITALLNISSTAALGARTVTVTNPNGPGTRLNGFTVLGPLPVVTSVSQVSGIQGANLAGVIINGSNFSGATAVSFGDGITVSNVSINIAGTQITCNLAIGASAAVGARNVTVTTANGQGILNAGFAVTSLTAPNVTSVSPNTGAQGQTLNGVVITGTNFTNITSISFGDGITMNNPSVNLDGLHITVNLVIASNATPGARTVTVTSSVAGQGTLPNGFTVTQVGGAPTVTGVNPSSGAQGQTLAGVIITGTNFSGTPAVSFGDNITVSNIVVNSSTQITCNLSISSTAAAGSRTVSVTTTATGSKANAFTVTQPTVPVINTVTPNSGAQGGILSVQISGNNFNGTNAVDFGSGITVTSFNAASNILLNATLNISASAATGARTVTVTNASGPGVKAGAFTVTTPSTPTITSVDPNSGVQGKTVTGVKITGTNFGSSPAVSFGSGIAASISAKTATLITVNLVIDSTATPGTRDVSVTAGGLAATAPAAFTVVSSQNPLVNFFSPADNAHNISINTEVTAVFSKDMKDTTITTGTFTLSTGGKAIATTVSYDNASRTATLTPAALLANTTYTAAVTTGVRDTTGLAMEAVKTWTFTTSGLTAVAHAATFSVTLSWPVDTAAISYNVYRSTNGGATWGAPVSIASGTTTYEATGLSTGILYTFGLSSVYTANPESAKQTVDVSLTPPAAPGGGLSAQAGGSKVTLGWTITNTESTFAGYKIYTSLNGGATWDSGTSVGKVVSFVMTKLTNGKVYTFALSAVDTAGNESAPSQPPTQISAQPVAAAIASSGGGGGGGGGSGVTSSVSVPGPTGAPGAAGPAGPQGSTGAAGAAGPKGDTGAQGSAGAAGATGAKGDTGTQGSAGAAGAVGPTGPQGPAGKDASGSAVVWVALALAILALLIAIFMGMRRRRD